MLTWRRIVLNLAGISLLKSTNYSEIWGSIHHQKFLPRSLIQIVHSSSSINLELKHRYLRHRLHMKRSNSLRPRLQQRGNNTSRIRRLLLEDINSPIPSKDNKPPRLHIFLECHKSPRLRQCLGGNSSPRPRRCFKSADSLPICLRRRGLKLKSLHRLVSPTATPTNSCFPRHLALSRHAVAATPPLSSATTLSSFSKGEPDFDLAWHLADHM